MMKPELQTTADGSHTLYLPDMDEHYHSVNGAVIESLHVYITAGLKQCNKSIVRVLELGFGTGLNTLLTALECENRQINIEYTTIEKFPLPNEIAMQLNYNLLNKELFCKIHASEWNKVVVLNDQFSLLKQQCDFNDYAFTDSYDVIYYDAFAPDKQPEVWTQSLFNKLFAATNPDGILVTYCAKGSVRRGLQQAGFVVERIPGSKGKREMIRGRKIC